MNRSFDNRSDKTETKSTEAGPTETSRTETSRIKPSRLDTRINNTTSEDAMADKDIGADIGTGENKNFNNDTHTGLRQSAPIQNVGSNDNAADQQLNSVKNSTLFATDKHSSIAADTHQDSSVNAQKANPTAESLASHDDATSSASQDQTTSTRVKSFEETGRTAEKFSLLNGVSQTPNLFPSQLSPQTKAQKAESENHGSAIFWSDFKWLVSLVIAGAGLGWYIGSVAWGIIISLLIYYVWRLFAIQQFYNWMNQSLTLPPPDFSGSMTFMANQLYESKKQEQITSQKMMGLIKKIRSSLLALQDAVILLDENDSLEWWNQAAESLLALRSEDQGRSILELINLPEFEKYYTTAISPNEGLRLRSWRDFERFLQCEVTHFGNEKLLIIYDVTRLQHLEQMRKDFVGNVSHELRTPLTVLMGYIETFSDQPDLDPKWQRGFNLMTQQTERMNRIINDLLLLSRLENEEDIKFDKVDMPKLLTSIFDDAQIYNKQHSHFIELHIDSQKNVLGSEVYLNSALLNLVTNAIKYTPNGGEIGITWQEVKGGCLFSVSDNGLGIASEHIDRLTERFYRVDSGRSRATGGTGLGLAIVKHVVYQHGAKLSIESEEGKGSTFNILFPDSLIYRDEEDELDSEASDALV